MMKIQPRRPRRSRSVLGLYVCFVTLVCFVAPFVAAQPRPPAQAPAGRPDVGRTLFVKTGCFQCHGAEGQGGAAGPRLGPGAISFARMSYVRKTTGEMPPYTTKVLSDRDLADIYACLESLPKPVPASSIPLLAP